MGLDQGILVKLTQFLIIMILCLIFVEFTQWCKGIFWVIEKYPILLIPNLHVYQGRSQH